MTPGSEAGRGSVLGLLGNAPALGALSSQSHVTGALELPVPYKLWADE